MKNKIGYLFLFILGYMLSSIACNSSKQTIDVPTVEAKSMLQDLGVEKIMRDCHIIPMMGFATSDVLYAVPSEEWASSEFLDQLRRFQFSLQQTHYKSESNDCDDFAKMAAAFARLVHSNSPNSRGSSISIGEFYYTSTDSGSGHAINFMIVVAKSGDFKLLFFDPQTWNLVKLSEREIESCLNWIL